jgi:nitroreductase
MDIIEAINARKSIRDFKNDPVPQAIIQEILEISCRAPSAMNIQPWEFTVIANETLDAVRSATIERLRAGIKPHAEHMVAGWPKESVYRQRQVELGREIFRLMDIQKEDTNKRSEWLERGFRYFNAPVAIIISVDRLLAEGTPILDIGSVTQTLCLTALHYGLGTCIQNQGVMYPEVLREFCNISENKQIIIALALGYPNWDFPANQLETTREPVEKLSTWHGFH